MENDVIAVALFFKNFFWLIRSFSDTLVAVGVIFFLPLKIFAEKVSRVKIHTLIMR